jgi:hypothetical protein
MLAYGEGKFLISSKHISLAVNDTEAADPISSGEWLTWALPAAVCAIVTMSLVVHGDILGNYQNIVSLVSEWHK